MSDFPNILPGLLISTIIMGASAIISTPAVDQSEFSSYLLHFNEGGGAEGSDIGY